MSIVNVSVDRIREDFAKIFELNAQNVILVRESSPESGNYGYIGDTNTESQRIIRLNIQGVTSDSYDRKRQGIDSSRSVFHCYAYYDEDIINTDLILMNGVKYVIKNWNQSFKDGQTGFQEFDIESRPGK